jgi:DNA-binding MarR family transcriptional regulator
VSAQDDVDRVIAGWQRERPDLDTTAMGVVGRLLLVARRADETLSAPLRERGLERGWFDLLAALRLAGPPYELNPTALMGSLMLSSGGMTKRLDTMERAGLIERHPDPGDRRGRLARLTPAGKRLVDRAVGIHAANENRLLGPLDGAELEALDGSLRKLLAALDDTRAG